MKLDEASQQRILGIPASKRRQNNQLAVESSVDLIARCAAQQALMDSMYGSRR